MDVKIKATQVNCVVPGNIHTPTMEGIRNCEGLKGGGGGGGGGFKGQRNFRGEGNSTVDLVSRWAVKWFPKSFLTY